MGSEKTLCSTTTVMPGTMCACGRTRQASLKRGLHRREGKGRHFFLGDIIDSIPYCASYFTDLMKRPICNQDELKNRVKFSLFFNSSWCKIASAARNLINSVPQEATTTSASSSVKILLLCICHTFCRDSLFISLIMLVTVSIWVAWGVSGLTVPALHQVRNVTTHAHCCRYHCACALLLISLRMRTVADITTLAHWCRYHNACALRNLCNKRNTGRSLQFSTARSYLIKDFIFKANNSSFRSDLNLGK